MRRRAPTTILLAFLAVASPQLGSSRPVTPEDPAGRWSATLEAGARSLRLELEVAESDEGAWTAAVVSLDQGRARIPATSSVWQAPAVRLQFGSIAASFEGILSGDSIEGTWRQGGAELPLIWRRSTGTTPPSEPDAGLAPRPQNPTGDLPYRSLDVAVDGPAGTVAGTLLLPGLEQHESPHPWVVLFSGSGQQDRDETIFGHRPFLVLADALARRGLAVFRYDDRGIGGSTGNPTGATTEDFAADGLAVLLGLGSRPDLDPDRVGLVGHSEGALIAAHVAARTDVLAIVAIGGPALPGTELLTEQAVDLARASGTPPDQLPILEDLQRSLLEIAASDLDDEAARRSLYLRFVELGRAVDVDQAAATWGPQIDQLLLPWTRFFLRLDPRDWWRPVDVSVLALFGERDLQVAAESNAEALRGTLDGPHQEIVVVPGVNHLMQPAETGLPTEYGRIEITISEPVLRRIGDFFVARLMKDPEAPGGSP